MRLRLLVENYRGYEPVPELRELLGAIVENLPMEPLIVVRGRGDEAMISVPGDRRSLIVRTNMDGDREGETWRYYRVEDNAGQTIKHSRNPLDIVAYVTNRFAGRRIHEDSDCVRSGFCCRRAPCPFGEWDPEAGQCTSLEQDEEVAPGVFTTKCGKYDEIQRSGRGEMSPAFGTGCCSSLFNTERDAIIKARKLRDKM